MRSFLDELGRLHLQPWIIAAIVLIGWAYRLVRHFSIAVTRPGMTERQTNRLLKSARTCVALFLIVVVVVSLIMAGLNAGDFRWLHTFPTATAGAP